MRRCEKSASFPGGLEAWGKYLQENMKYPEQAQRLGVQGRVFVQFIVEKNGELSDIHVVKGIGAGCDSNDDGVGCLRVGLDDCGSENGDGERVPPKTETPP